MNIVVGSKGSELELFERLESRVRTYSRSFPRIFKSAQGSLMVDEGGQEFIDLLSGAGALNYGHNNPDLKAALLGYLNSDGIVHGLDLATVAKRDFIDTFERLILKPRDMTYKLQFTGPTGTNAVEAALKIARKATGRTAVVFFTNGFHGATLGAVAATGNRHYRSAAGLPASGTAMMPYDGYLGEGVNTAEYLEKTFADSSSGIDLPAAVIVETVQGEGGINVARTDWLLSVQAVCRKHGVLLIVDDIQMGCGRTDSFFSFDQAGLVPDIVTLSKSLSGYGLPFAVVLLKPGLDCWEPGEHTGTFRGNNLAFVAGTAALEIFWSDGRFAEAVRRKGQRLRHRLEQIAEQTNGHVSIRGRGLVQGIDCRSGAVAKAITGRAFQSGVIIETCGSDDQVIKFLPALTIDDDTLEKGIDILEEATCQVAAHL